MHKNTKLRIAVLVLGSSIIALQGLYLSQNFDAYALIQSDVISGWQILFGYMGSLARWGLSFVAAAALILNKRALTYWRYVLDTYSIKNMFLIGAIQMLSFMVLYYITDALFAPENINSKPPYWYWLWLISALSCGILWALMWVSPAAGLKFFRREAFSLILAAIAATAIALLSSYTSSLWGPLANYTFDLTAFLLNVISNGDVISVKDERILGLNAFLVNIAPVCSGYEGIGLITAFVALFIYTHKQQLRFPQCLVLFPIGITLIWLLNVVRIVVLVLIGAHWSEEVAVGGFHSFGGWITFILVSLGLLWMASRSRWISSGVNSKKTAAGLNLPIATLIPIITLLSATILTSALTASFDWLYPLRVLLVAIALAWVWRHINLGKLQVQAEPIALGLLTAIIWYLTVPPQPDYNQEFSQTLFAADPWLAWGWLGLRFIGSVVTVPIAEELAFRGYLLCSLAKNPITLNGKLTFSLTALIISSIIFGALHGDWVAGILAGLIYGFVRYRCETVQGPILAHSTTNLALFVCALSTGNWNLI